MADQPKLIDVSERFNEIKTWYFEHRPRDNDSVVVLLERDFEELHELLFHVTLGGETP